MIPHPSTPPPSEEALAELEELRTENRRARQEQIVASAASVEATTRVMSRRQQRVRTKTNGAKIPAAK